MPVETPEVQKFWWGAIGVAILRGEVFLAGAPPLAMVVIFDMP